MSEEEQKQLKRRIEELKIKLKNSTKTLGKLTSNLSFSESTPNAPLDVSEGDKGITGDQANFSGKPSSLQITNDDVDQSLKEKIKRYRDLYESSLEAYEDPKLRAEERLKAKENVKSAKHRLDELNSQLKNIKPAEISQMAETASIENNTKSKQVQETSSTSFTVPN
ncbi:uncharacterized protein L201_001343 [Kwoniella dendrophila CBS 6074]|uniref:Uncharacterized protein n=1 Tax=Kwoniella dendrophila CBS 6074 TaxID=1295534 RepID=A0AAX4JN36_9TREE